MLKKILPKYELYRVFQVKTSNKVITLTKGYEFVNLKQKQFSEQELYKQTIKYSGASSYGFGLVNNNELIAVQWYWFGSRCNNLDYCTMTVNSIMSMQIQVQPKYQGKGLSTLLKSHAAKALSLKGFNVIYSRVWHNHSASIAMNRRLNAKQVGWLFYIELFGTTLKLKKSTYS